MTHRKWVRDSQSVCSVLARHAHLYHSMRRCLPTAMRRKDNSMSETGKELELQSDKIVDKKGLAKSIIWNWFGHFKNDKAQKTTVCKTCRQTCWPRRETRVTYWSTWNGSAPATTPRAWGHGPKKAMMICCHFPVWKTFIRSADINNAVSYFIAKNTMPFWQKKRG